MAIVTSLQWPDSILDYHKLALHLSKGLVGLPKLVFSSLQLRLPPPLLDLVVLYRDHVDCRPIFLHFVLQLKLHLGYTYLGLMRNMDSLHGNKSWQLHEKIYHNIPDLLLLVSTKPNISRCPKTSDCKLVLVYTLT